MTFDFSKIFDTVLYDFFLLPKGAGNMVNYHKELMHN